MKEKIKKIINGRFFRLWILIFVGIMFAALISAYYFISDSQLDWRSSVSHLTGPRSRRLLDGEMVAQELSALKPLAVMLENHAESRPVAGLEYVSIIYETIVEGDITRFLAIFDGDVKSSKIGPVRSIRPFFVELAEEWNAVLLHAGGSQDAMYKLTYSPIYNINEISGDGIYFWRDAKRIMPHNLFTSANLIDRALDAKGIDRRADFEPWLFKNDSPDRPDYPDYPTGEKWEKVYEIKVDFNNNPLYQVEYRYNPENNDYTRYLAGAVHETERGIVLKAKNIIFQHVDSDIIDDYGRLDVNITGKGHAEIYKDGRMIEAYWQKAKNGRTRFYDLGNREIKFNRGSIWVELIFN